ncbi:hypothetical protein U1Q18_012689 [Sarracenia purpurea var. burkii]
MPMINQTRQQTKYCLGVASQGTRKGSNEEDEPAFEKMKKDIEANQDNALSLCTEKVLLARQAYDLVCSRQAYDLVCSISLIHLSNVLMLLYFILLEFNVVRSMQLMIRKFYELCLANKACAVIMVAVFLGVCSCVRSSFMVNYMLYRLEVAS